MSAPTAMPSSTRAPGFYLKIDLTANPANAGSSALRALLIASKLSTGDITAGTEVRTCGGPDDVKAALGEGAIGHLSALQMYAAFGNLQLDVVAPAEPSGSTATVTFTIAGSATDDNQFVFYFSGRKTDVCIWAAGESIGTFRTRCVDKINALRTELGLALLPITASAGTGGGDVDVDANGPGSWGNDITCRVKKLRGTGGTVTAGAAALATGSGEFSIAAVLSTISVTEYAAIGLATSNEDAEDDSSSSNAQRLQNHIETKKEGLDALLQYGYVADTGTIANVKLGAIGRNGVDLTYAYAQNAQGLPAELMGWELGDSMRWYQQRASYNRIGNVAPHFIGSSDKNADKLTGPEKEDLLSNGVTPYDFGQSGTLLHVVSPITTHSQDASGNNDTRAYWQLDTWAFNFVGRDLRTSVPQEFPNASITEDLPAGADALPPGVVERRDVYSFVVGRLRAMVPLGVLQSNYLEAVIESGELIVEIDGTDASQVNIFIPARAVKPLAKFSSVVHKTG